MTGEVLVVGAGSAGLAAAVAAADAGCRVRVLEHYGFAGGQACSALVGTVCGLYHRGGETPRPVHGGFPLRFATALQAASGTPPVRFDQGLWFLPYRPYAFRHVADHFLRRGEIVVDHHTTLAAVQCEGGRITRVEAVNRSGRHSYTPDVVVDASGDAMVSVLAGLPLLPEEPGQTGAVVVGLGGLPDLDLRPLHLLLGTCVLRACDAGALPDFCKRISVVPGTLDRGTALIKLGLPHLDGDGEVFARDGIHRLVEVLRAVPDFAHVFITEAPAQVGVRSSRRPVGRSVLTGSDVTACRDWEDGVATGTWPIEFWRGEARPEMTYLPEECGYALPAGALESERVDNLLFAGRALSADEAAAASARVIGTCLATGTAAGHLAAGIVRGDNRAATIARIRQTLEVPHDL